MDNVIKSEDLFSSPKDESDHQATIASFMDAESYAHNNPENSADNIFIGTGICLIAFLQLTLAEYGGLPLPICLLAPLTGIALGLKMFLRNEELSTNIFPDLKTDIATEKPAALVIQFRDQNRRRLVNA